MRQGSLPRQGDQLYKSVSGKPYCPNDASDLGSMSASPLKADMCGATSHVGSGPEADIAAGPRIVERWERLPASFALDDASLSLGCQPSWVA